MAKNYYAVKRGYDKTNDTEIENLIFEDWYQVKPLVIGYDNARYKGFDTKEEAETWLSVVDSVDAKREKKDTNKTDNNLEKSIAKHLSISATELDIEIAQTKALKEYMEFLKDKGYDYETCIGKITETVVRIASMVY